MSHFSLLVITDRKPTMKHLEKVLQPWHEFECTGKDDKYVKDIDRTSEMRANYEKDTTRRLKDPEGVYHEPWSDRFYRDPTPEESKKIGRIAGTGAGHGMSWSSRDWEDGRGYRTKIQFVPDGWSKVEVPYSQLMSFRQYVADQIGEGKEVHPGQEKHPEKHKYGYTLLDANGDVDKVIDRTNPNAKWDWWMVGGRYGGKLRSKSGKGLAGEAGVFGPNDQQKTGGLDVVQVGDLDLDLMRRTVSDSRKKIWRSFLDKHGLDEGETIRLWGGFARNVAEMTRRWEETDPRPNRWDFFREHGTGEFKESMDVAEKICSMFDGVDIPETQHDVRKWMDHPPFITCYAFVTAKGEWVASGDMGWWGLSKNEVDGVQWEDRVSKMVESLPSDHWLTVVDCHI